MRLHPIKFTAMLKLLTFLIPITSAQYLGPLLNYSTTHSGIASGPVVLLTPSDKFSNDQQSFLMSTQQKWGDSNNIRISWDILPITSYDQYISNIQTACSAKQANFDLVWINSLSVSSLSNCLLDVWEYDSQIAFHHDKNIIWNGIVNKKLLAIPAENDFGVLYYNNDLLESSNYFNALPNDLDGFNDLWDIVVEQLKGQDKFSTFGFGSALQDEGLAAAAFEWFAAANQTIFDNFTDSQTAIADMFTRLSSWTTHQILESSKLGQSTEEQALDDWLNSRTVFLRNWISLKNQVSTRAGFEWKVSPILTTTPYKYTGTYNGWQLGVYKYSPNPFAAIKTLKYLTSKEYQKKVITSAPIPIVPTYPDLFTDPDIRKVLGESNCDIFLNTSIVLRPSTITGIKYTNISIQLQNAVLGILSEQASIPEALKTMEINIKKILSNSTVINVQIELPSKSQLRTLAEQVFGFFAMGFFLMGVYMFIFRWTFSFPLDGQGIAMVQLGQINKKEVEIEAGNDGGNESKDDGNESGEGIRLLPVIF